MSEPNVPHFRVRRQNETLHEFSRSIPKRCSHRKVGTFSLYELDPSLLMSEQVVELMQSPQNVANFLPVLGDWAKSLVSARAALSAV